VVATEYTLNHSCFVV